MTPLTRHSALTVGCAILIAAFLTGPPPLTAQQAPAPHEAAHEHAQHQPAGMPLWEGSAEGKAYSEFNHHLAGVFVLLIGLSEVRSAVALPLLAWSRFLLPAALLAAGGYLLIWSDHEAWPVGTMSLIQTLTSGDPEILQHKTYAVLLLAVGTIELLRHLGRIRHGFWRAPLPVFAIIGGLLLFLHSHGVHPSAHKIAVHHALMGTLAISAGACKLGACPTLALLLRRTMHRHLHCSRPRKILNVFQRIRLRFFGACGRASAGASLASSQTAMSDRLLVPGRTTGGPATQSGLGAASTGRSRWDLAWAGLICLIGIQLLVYSE